MIDLSCAGLRIRIDSFSLQSLFDNWEWKIDPWKCHPGTDISKESTIEITRAESEIEWSEALPVLFVEKTGFFERRVYELSDHTTIWELVRTSNEKIYLQFKMNATWNKISLLKDITETQGHTAFEYLAQMMPGICLKHRILTFHAALIEYERSAFMICASSGTGKTTHARLWRDYKNALILNGDRALCKKTKIGWTAYGTPWSGTSGEQINRSTPLKAIVVLERGSRNEVCHLSGIEIFSKVFPHMLYPFWNKDMTEIAMTQLEELLEDLTVYRLKCRPDIDSVDILYQALYGG